MSLLAKSLLCLAVFLPQAAPQSVPVGDEPRHQVVFSNKYVRVIDARVPVGDVTLYHTHSEDNVPIAISGGRMRTQVLDKEPTESTIQTGGIWWAKASYTHQITNIGDTPLRFIDAEILAPSPTPSTAPPLENVKGMTLEIENEKVRIYRVKLGPGESTSPHTHARARLDVAITAGKLAATLGKPKKGVVEVKPGEHAWHEAGSETRHAIENAGDTVFEAVEIEWK
jgi:quercetin dioxygenase-like cupin family protein